jgi:hypothetical protein
MSEANPGKGNYVPRNAASLGQSGPAIGIFSTYAPSMVVADCPKDSLTPTGKCGHTGIVVIDSSGGWTMYDTQGGKAAGYYSTLDNPKKNDLFNANSYSTFYWISPSDLKV